MLYVRDVARSVAFYRDVLGFREVHRMPTAAFLRAAESDNDHDLGLFQIGEQATDSPAGRSAVGLYHLAWSVGTLAELAEHERRLREAGSLVGSSDHVTTKALYAKDPDGLEFEVMGLVPAEHWGAEEHEAIIRPLDIPAEQRRFAALMGSDGE